MPNVDNIDTQKAQKSEVGACLYRINQKILK